MLTQIEAVKQRNEELKNRAERDAIAHETVQGEDPILNENGKRNYTDKAAVSTTDDCR